jgi:hypothetical protein
MSLKGVFAAVFCAALLAAGVARADGYRPEEFFTLDLPKAVFSPKRLGPPAQFEQVQVQAKTDFQSKPVRTTPVHVTATSKAAMPKAAAKIRAVHARAAARAAVHARAEKPRAPARTRLVRRHRNPLDAQASDTRIQVWPCRSGGICNWQRSPQ